MDTSKIYVKMCEKAVEIQNSWIWKEGDYFSSFPGKKIGIVGIGTLNTRDTMLPRQDQLQEMVYRPENTNAVCAMFQEISDFGWSFPYSDNSGMTKGIDLTSGEQLWLAFVMHEKYGETWNGEDWVNPSAVRRKCRRFVH